MTFIVRAWSSFNRWPVAIRVAVIGALVTLIAAGPGMLSSSYELVERRRPGLRISDILVADGGNHAILDIKVLNRSESPIILDRLSISVESDSIVGAFCCFSESSHDYTLDLSGSREVPLHQSVPPKGTDRFRLVIAAKGDPGGVIRYWIQPVIRFDGSEHLDGPKFAIDLMGVTRGSHVSFVQRAAQEEPSFDSRWRDPVRDPAPPPMLEILRSR
jgi:hypothetical protein